MFIGRERELKTLKRLYDADTFQFSVIYGRRRVGKTALMTEFTRGLPTVFFTAVESDARVNLRNFSREIHLLEHPDRAPETAPVYSDFHAAFGAVFELARNRRLALVIDEFPYLANAEPGVASFLQALIDRNRESSRLFLILCGSALSFMKEQVLDEKSPLYGRRTAQLEIAPFDFFDSLRFLEGMAPTDAAQAYGMVGGIPLYLRQFDGSLDLAENIGRVFLDPSSILYEEPTNLLLQEVNKAARYNAVLAAIAEGASQNNEIAAAVGLTSTEITYYLKELQRIGLIVRERPVPESGRRAVYRIADNLFRVWHRFILPHRQTIERGIAARALRALETGMATYMGPVFEDICRQWLWRQYAGGRLDFAFDAVGRWWGGDAAEKREAELDIVCLEGKRAVALGECKWRDTAFPASDLERLVERGRLVRAAATAPVYAFAKSGFTEACREMSARNPAICLVDFAQMVRGA